MAIKYGKSNLSGGGSCEPLYNKLYKQKEVVVKPEVPEYHGWNLINDKEYELESNTDFYLMTKEEFDALPVEMQEQAKRIYEYSYSKQTAPEPDDVMFLAIDVYETQSGPDSYAYNWVIQEATWTGSMTTSKTLLHIDGNWDFWHNSGAPFAGKENTWYSSGPGGNVEEQNPTIVFVKSDTGTHVDLLETYGHKLKGAWVDQEYEPAVTELVNVILENQVELTRKLDLDEKLNLTEELGLPEYPQQKLVEHYNYDTLKVEDLEVGKTYKISPYLSLNGAFKDVPTQTIPSGMKLAEFLDSYNAPTVIAKIGNVEIFRANKRLYSNTMYNYTHYGSDYDAEYALDNYYSFVIIKKTLEHTIEYYFALDGGMQTCSDVTGILADIPLLASGSYDYENSESGDPSHFGVPAVEPGKSTIGYLIPHIWYKKVFNKQTMRPVGDVKTLGYDQYELVNKFSNSGSFLDIEFEYTDDAEVYYKDALLELINGSCYQGRQPLTEADIRDSYYYATLYKLPQYLDLEHTQLATLPCTEAAGMYQYIGYMSSTDYPGASGSFTKVAKYWRFGDTSYLYENAVEIEDGFMLFICYDSLKDSYGNYSGVENRPSCVWYIWSTADIDDFGSCFKAGQTAKIAMPMKIKKHTWYRAELAYYNDSPQTFIAVDRPDFPISIAGLSGDTLAMMQEVLMSSGTYNADGTVESHTEKTGYLTVDSLEALNKDVANIKSTIESVEEDLVDAIDNLTDAIEDTTNLANSKLSNNSALKYSYYTHGGAEVKFRDFETIDHDLLWKTYFELFGSAAGVGYTLLSTPDGYSITVGRYNYAQQYMIGISTPGASFTYSCYSTYPPYNTSGGWVRGMDGEIISKPDSFYVDSMSDIKATAAQKAFLNMFCDLPDLLTQTLEEKFLEIEHNSKDTTPLEDKIYSTTGGKPYTGWKAANNWPAISDYVLATGEEEVMAYQNPGSGDVIGVINRIGLLAVVCLNAITNVGAYLFSISYDRFEANKWYNVATGEEIVDWPVPSLDDAYITDRDLLDLLISETTGPITLKEKFANIKDCAYETIPEEVEINKEYITYTDNTPQADIMKVYTKVMSAEGCPSTINTGVDAIIAGIKANIDAFDDMTQPIEITEAGDTVEIIFLDDDPTASSNLGIQAEVGNKMYICFDTEGAETASTMFGSDVEPNTWYTLGMGGTLSKDEPIFYLNVENISGLDNRFIELDIPLYQFINETKTIITPAKVTTVEEKFNNTCFVLTEAPTEDNTSGQLGIVVLSDEPAERFSGYIYVKAL